MTRSFIQVLIVCVLCCWHFTRWQTPMRACVGSFFKSHFNARWIPGSQRISHLALSHHAEFFLRVWARERYFHIARNGNALLLCVITLRGAHKKRGAEMNLFLPQSAPCDKKREKSRAEQHSTLIIINSVLSSQHTPTFCSAADYIFLLGD